MYNVWPGRITKFQTNKTLENRSGKTGISQTVIDPNIGQLYSFKQRIDTYYKLFLNSNYTADLLSGGKTPTDVLFIFGRDATHFSFSKNA